MSSKNIRERLENWALWAKWVEGGRGSDCMTGAICESLRKARCGNVYDGLNPRPEIDEADAVRVELAWRAQSKKHREILVWTYIKNARPEVVCRKLDIPARPITVFIQIFRDAEDAIQRTLDSIENLGVSQLSAAGSSIRR